MASENEDYRTKKYSDNSSCIFVRVGNGSDKEAREIYERINQFRLASGWTWKRFVLVGLAEQIYNENPVLARDIAEFLVRDTQERHTD